MNLTSVLIGFLFIPITLLTPSLILSFFGTLLYSYLLASGLTTQLELLFEIKFNDIILTLCIAALSGVTRLCYRYKYGNLESITNFNTDVKG
jgi:fucose 4-O-acetylase-like acetyltransferase